MSRNIKHHSLLLPYCMDQYDAEIEALYASLFRQSCSDILNRLQFISEAFLGEPYLGGALGEGPEGLFDQSPVYRTDAFDCLTYVATVLALARSHDVVSFKKTLCDISYLNGELCYHERHHFMSADWNKHNAERGYIQDMTTSIVDALNQPMARVATTWIDRQAWISRRSLLDIKQLSRLSESQAESLLGKLHAFSTVLHGESAKTAYLPMDQLIGGDKKPNEVVFQQIPGGVIIEIVRPNWDVRDKIGTCLNVSHLGFGFWLGDQLVFRHASAEAGKVEEVLLSDYLIWCMETIETVKGVNLQRVLSAE